MNFLKLFLRGIALLPSMIQDVEALFGAKTGDAKKTAVLDVVKSAIDVPAALASKTIVDGDGFTAGLSSVVDGVVQCLNASIWAKSPATPAAPSDAATAASA